MIRTERADLDLVAQGAMLATVIRNLDAGFVAEAATIAPTKAPKATRQSKPKAPKAPKAKPVDDKPVAATVLNWEGKAMLCEPETASKGQQKWLTENSELDATFIAEISMVDASNYRALLTGKITVAKYNRLP